jgi:pimeloyl-ACP methyl ester carboxylesterase
MTGGVEMTPGRAAGLTLLSRAGSGPALVALHGIGSNAASFAPLVAHLPPGTPVIAWNAPGYGGSQPLDAPWPTAADYAARLADLLDALGQAGPVTLLGHSLGCLVAAAFAARHPDRVARLVLASPALGHGAPVGGPLGVAAQARLDDLARLGPDAFAAARAPRLLHRPETCPETAAAVTAAMAAIDPAGYAQAVRMLASGRLADDLAGLALPAEVIVGAEDIITPPDAARRAHAALPDACRGPLTLVPGCGHALPQQAPEALARRLAAATAPAH